MVKSLSDLPTVALAEAKRHYLRNPIRRHAIDRRMTRALDLQGTDCARAIIFALPGFDRADGGLFSLASLVAESNSMRAIHGAQVYACPLPDEPPIDRYTKFDNALEPVPYWQLVRRLVARGSEILLHMPECYVPRARRIFGLDWLKRRNVRLKINILLQNVDVSPSPADVALLGEYGPVSITTAHKAYSTPETAERLGAPIHHLSVWLCPERFQRSSWADKRNLILLSPDPHPQRATVIRRLMGALPDFEFVTVRDLHYRDYRTLCSAAKLAITFGEGLDGYYVETIFSGGLSATVFNDRFFTGKYRRVPLIYPDWETLAARLPQDLGAADAPAAYAALNARLFAAPASDYSGAEYRKNLETFYARVFPAPQERDLSPALEYDMRKTAQRM